MTDAALLVDRFVSASSATDAHNSLQALLEGLKSREEDKRIPPEFIWQDHALLEALLQVLTTGSYKDVPLEEGPSLVCRIYQQLWKQDGASLILLKEPSPGRLMQSLLDVVSDTQSMDYTRVVGLQVLNDVCTKAPSLAQSQLLEIPNGLHRLADIFKEQNDQVRNELLGGVSQKIAKWPSCAKIWVFSEVCDVLLDIAMQEGGLTRGNVLVADCLVLVESLVDPTLADLIWQSPGVAPKLAALLDLREGTEFINPPKPQVSQSDDLDDILATGDKKKNTEQVLPKLTFNEEDIVIKVLNILGVLLENPASRLAVWKQNPPLCNLVWALALVSPPLHGKPPPCAFPSSRLQQLALETTALYLSNYDFMKASYGEDCLMVLICTGGTLTTKWDEKLGLSQAALHVLRQTLSKETAREILTHTLAPPMTSEDDMPPTATVVQKLLNTVFENMLTKENLERRRITLLGALGALTVFFNSPTDREVMLGITSSANLVDTLLQCLEQDEDEVIRLALLRFACEWVVEAPTVVQAFLASTQSVVLSVLLGTQSSVGTMVGYLLGLFMEYMGNDEDKHGGWTKQSIMELLSKRGISGYTTDLEKLKSADLPWKACGLEWQRFMKWYSTEVLAIRRCVVHELTSGSEAEGDDEEDELGSSHASTKSLNRLLSQQSKELEELRVSLSEAKATIESQESQLTVWRRRVESTPTQLDDMLTEYTNKNAEMEKEVSSLKKAMQEKEESVQAQLQERDDQLVQLQATVQEWEARDLESRQERDDLRGELQGLTSAYATLEQEYNRREGPSMQGAAASAPTGETSDARPGQQPEGEVSHQEQSSSPELATLRAENARLRSDAQAADDWMAMAVQRMNDIGGQNQALQQQVATLQGQLQQATLTGGIVAPVVTGISQEQLDEERQRREQLEQRLAEAGTVSARLESEIGTLRQQLEESSEQAVDSGLVEDLKRRLAEEETRRQDLESQLQSSQTDTRAAMDSLGDSKSEKERLGRIVANMEDELQDARSEIATLREERDRYERGAEQSATMAAAVVEKDTLLASKDSELESMRSLVASKDEELGGLREQLTESRESAASDLDGRNQELVSLRESVQTLSEELEKMRVELDDTTSREREEIQNRDERIRELESSQNQQQSRDVSSSDAAGFFGSGGADNRDEEIKSLREANTAAQDWMAKAVEHHQMLSDQVAALTEDKAALAEQIKVLEQSCSVASQTKPDASRETIDKLERDLSERTTEVTDLGARIIKLESEVRIKETEMAGVQEKIARCELLQTEVNSLEGERDAELEKTRTLEEKVAQVVAEKESFVAELDSLRQELNEKEALVASTTDASSDEIESLKELLRVRETEIDSLREELETAKDVFADADQLRITLQNARDESSRLRMDLDDTRSKLASMKDKTASCEQLQAELQAMREMTSQLEVDRDANETDIADLERLRNEITSSAREIDSLTQERDSLKENVSQLESQLSEFQAWADAAQLKISQLQNEKDVLEQEWKSSVVTDKGADSSTVDGLRDELASLTTERDTLKVTVSELESQLSEFQSWADAAQLKITELQNEKEAAEQQMEKLKETDEEPDSTAVDALRDEIASVKIELAALTLERDTLNDTVSEKELQLSEFQSWSDAAQLRITELQNEKEAAEQEIEKLKDTDEEPDSTAVDALRDEIASVRNELATMTLERDTLKDTVSEKESQLSEFQSWSDAAQLRITELQNEKEAAEQEIEKLKETDEEPDNTAVDALRDEIASVGNELATMTLERDTLKDTVSEMESQLSEFQSWSDAAQLKITELEDEKEAVEQEMKKLLNSDNDANNAVEGLRDEIASLKSELATLTLERDTLKNTSSEMESQLSEFQSWSDAAELKISELEDKKEAAEQEMKKLLDSAIDANNAVEALRDEIASLKSEIAAVATERDTLEDTVSEQESQLSELQSWSDAAQLKISEFQDEKDSREQEMNALVELEKKAREQLDSLREDLESKATELSSALQENDELKAAKANLDSLLERMKLECDNLYGKNSSLEQDLKVLETQCSDLVSRSTQAEAAVKEKENALRDVEDNAAELQSALEAIQEQSADVVEEWKGK